MTVIDMGEQTVPLDAAAATSDAEWLSLMGRIGEESGYLKPLGSRHHALFMDEDPTLLVCFDTIHNIRMRPGQLPAGFAVAREMGWSYLALIADGDTWFRDPAIYSYFDQLVDDAFFEDFNATVFMGTDMGAYAACAYSVTAPGATVLAFNPRATMDLERAGWDNRARAARRIEFRSRYGYAPDMTEGTGKVFAFHDPGVLLDAVHVSLFAGPWVTPVRMPYLAGRTEWALAQMGLMPELLQQAMKGTLTTASFARMWRARRNFGPYLKGILAATEDAGKPRRALGVCTSVVKRLNAPRFRRRWAEVQAAMGDNQ
ncbi:MAG: phosphoadenosine phosphosulfate reductase [Paracoccaceae bacterium]